MDREHRARVVAHFLVKKYGMLREAAILHYLSQPRFEREHLLGQALCYFNLKRYSKK